MPPQPKLITVLTFAYKDVNLFIRLLVQFSVEMLMLASQGVVPAPIFICTNFWLIPPLSKPANDWSSYDKEPTAMPVILDWKLFFTILLLPG